MKSYSLILMMQVFIGICTLSHAAQAVDIQKYNFIDNPSFEINGAVWQNEIWQKNSEENTPAFEYDKSVFHTGEFSAKIYCGINKVSHGMWYQSIKVMPDVKYYISCWTKSKNIKDGLGLIWLRGRNDKECISYRDFGRVVGTTDWFKQEEVASFSGDVKTLVLTPRMEGKGTVWFDDVLVTYLFIKQLSDCQQRIDYSEKKLSTLNSGITPLEKAELEKSIIQLKKKLNDFSNKLPELKSLGKDDVIRFQNEISPLERETNELTSKIRLADMAATAGKDSKINVKNCLTFVVNPISTNMVLPDTEISARNLGDALNIKLTRGEYEPASFVLCPFDADLQAVTFKVSDLKSKNGATLPQSAIDIRVVKCWYQGGTAWRDVQQDKNNKVLVPELLLKDDSLVKVDYQEQKNYVKTKDPRGDKYIWMSNPSATEKTRWNQNISGNDFCIQDSQDIKPVSIEKFRNKQFWVTIKAPVDAQADIYRGSIRLFSKDNYIGKIDINVTVLPFELSEPATYYDLNKEFISGIYDASIFDPLSKGQLDPHHRNEKQIVKQFENLAAHQVTAPFCYQLQTVDDLAVFKKILELRKAAGLKTRPVFMFGKEGNLGFYKADKPGDIERLVKRAKAIMDVIEETYGHRDVYFYGMDEREGEEQKQQKQIWKALHQISAKVFVAGMGDSFDNVGTVLDLCVYQPVPTRQEADRWHKEGKKIFSYCNPQAGVEDPEKYRRNYGLLLWKNCFDGASTYCYFEAFGHPWNDFDFISYRDHNFVYPTVDGVVDTIAWEGYREAIDDIRYATTLKQAIKKAQNTSDASLKKKASEAEKYLDGLNILNSDLDQVRSTIIKHILQLTADKK